MHIFLSGSHSILGSAVMESFFNSGHTLYSCPHLPPQRSEIDTLIQQNTGGKPMDMLFLLTGEEIFDTANTKKKIIKRCEEQIKVNELICNYFDDQEESPKIIFSVSSVLCYLDSSNDPATEMTSCSSGFVADYFKRIEEASLQVEMPNTRFIQLRLGKVISKLAAPDFPKLPFLAKYIPSVLKDKNRLISWVSQHDAVRAIHFIVENNSISGPVNIVSGDTVRRDDFFDLVARKFNILRTPPLPSFALKMLFGQEGFNLLHGSVRAMPLKLMEAGFLFNDISIHEYFKEPLQEIS